jgi:hypothetical protein
VRDIADREKLDKFLTAFAREATVARDVYLVGGSSAVVVGWRNSTVDIDLAIRPETDSLLRALPALKERLNVNVELASPCQDRRANISSVGGRVLSGRRQIGRMSKLIAGC